MYFFYRCNFFKINVFRWEKLVLYRTEKDDKSTSKKRSSESKNRCRGYLLLQTCSMYKYILTICLTDCLTRSVATAEERNILMADTTALESRVITCKTPSRKIQIPRRVISSVPYGHRPWWNFLPADGIWRTGTSERVQAVAGSVRYGAESLTFLQYSCCTLQTCQPCVAESSLLHRVSTGIALTSV